ncbi:MAG TPA: hypothetical protein VE567_03830, partial [Sphingomonas sp.]|nr:hypothetical protein [Sphingomonas sp.]
GAFRVAGQWEEHAPGPQLGDAGPPASKASLQGQVQGDMLALTVMREGGTAETLTLLRGRRPKLVRCF